MLKFFFLINLFLSATAIIAAPGTAFQNSKLFPIYEGGKIGYIDPAGKKVIEPQLAPAGPFNRHTFTPAQYFHEGLAVAARCSAETGKCREGFIDQSGQFVIPPVYEQAREFSEGLAAVRREGKWGFIGRRGEILIPPQFLEVDSFKNGFAVVTRPGARKELLDRAGTFLQLPETVEDFDRPAERMIAVKVRGRWGFIDDRGRIVIRPRFEPDLNDYGEDEYQGGFSNGLAIVKLNKKWGYVNRRGKLVVPAKFRGAMPFRSNGVAVVALGLYDWRLIDQRGRFVSRRFAALYDFSEGLAGAMVNDKWGFIDRRGKLVIAARFEAGSFFSEGLAAVKLNDKWGYIDRNGKFVIAPRFAYQGYFRDGLAEQVVDKTAAGRNNWGYLNRTGQFVWKSKAGF